MISFLATMKMPLNILWNRSFLEIWLHLWLLDCLCLIRDFTRIHAATHCNTLQHTATHGNTRQRAATNCNTSQHPSARMCPLRDGCSPCHLQISRTLLSTHRDFFFKITNNSLTCWSTTPVIWTSWTHSFKRHDLSLANVTNSLIESPRTLI